MKRLFYLILPAVILASCGSGNKAGKNADEVAKLKKQRSEIDQKLNTLEGSESDTSKKSTPVTIAVVQPADFTGYIQVQSQITGEQNVYASPQMGGIVKSVLIQAGQHVSQGQTLARLDAAAIEQQIEGQQAQLTLSQTLYEKQQKLWAQSIGTEVQLLTAKANYQSALKQRDALLAQRNMYSVVSPISGVVDLMNLKVGDATQPGAQNIRIVSLGKLKAEASLGENYLGLVHTGNPVTLIFPDTRDSIQTKLTYVAEAVDPISRAFIVQVVLGNDRKLHPNMSCIMKIANYENKNALIVPISVIQKTSKGEMLYIADGNKSKAAYVTTGHNSNGLVEILSGLNAGDKVITSGFEDLDNADPISIQE